MGVLVKTEELKASLEWKYILIMYLQGTSFSSLFKVPKKFVSDRICWSFWWFSFQNLDWDSPYIFLKTVSCKLIFLACMNGKWAGFCTVLLGACKSRGNDKVIDSLCSFLKIMSSPNFHFASLCSLRPASKRCWSSVRWSGWDILQKVLMWAAS